MSKCCWMVFAEGETEIELIKEIKNKHSLIISKVRKFNFWDNSARALLPLLDKKHGMVIIYDTDNLKNHEKFNGNIKLLSSCVGSIHLIQQNKNLEDELSYSCGCQKNKLFKHFSKRSLDSLSAEEFKRNFLGCNDKLRKLNAIGFDEDKFWSDRLGIIPSLISLKSFHSCYGSILMNIPKIKK